MRDLLLDAAHANLSILEASSVEEAKQICKVNRPDCIVLDNRLRGESGLALLREFADGHRPPKFPIVMLTGTGNEETAVQVMKLGAQDYLIKGRVTGDALLSSIRNAIEKVELLRQIEEQRQELLRLACTDDLTGLNNRRFFLSRLKEETTRTFRYNTPLSLLLMDVDHFKEINDRFGHPTGDVVLMRVARCIVQCLRNSDVAGRYGGEEFGVLLTNTDSAGAAAMAERLRTTIQEEEFHAAGEQFQITCSIGVAQFQVHAQNWDELLSVADQALYEAKHHGRNRVVFYSPR